MKVLFSKEELKNYKNGKVTINELVFLFKLSVLRCLLLDIKKQNSSFIFKKRSVKKNGKQSKM